MEKKKEKIIEIIGKIGKERIDWKRKGGNIKSIEIDERIESDISEKWKEKKDNGELSEKR